jgi:hypothetical protein
MARCLAASMWGRLPFAQEVAFVLGQRRHSTSQPADARSEIKDAHVNAASFVGAVGRPVCFPQGLTSVAASALPVASEATNDGRQTTTPKAAA